LKIIINEKKNYHTIIKKIENLRKKNNINWMDILRLAMKHDPKETKKNIKVIRPSFGIEPKNFEKILGKTAKVDLKFSTALKWKYIKK
jgi:sialic acid synthase SpsE